MLWNKKLMTVAVVAAMTAGGADRATAEPLTEQSPINIITADVVGDPAFKPITFNYSSNTNLVVKNINSPNVEGTIRGIPDAGSTVTYDGLAYNLLQFHFHIDAEHEVNGYRAPMEVHFVNQLVGASGINGLLVVGRFIEVSALDNPLLASFFSGISSIPNPDDTFSLTNFDVAAIAPIGQPVYRYTGSLTTVPYAEPVNWNVFYGTPLYLSQAQINMFSAAFPRDNSREIQALNGRTVTTAVPEIDPASFGCAIAMIVGSLALVERRRQKGFATASVA